MKYIINADDFGRTKTVNEAIVYGFNTGYLDRTTIMVNMPYYEEAVALSEKYGFKDRVGLHINLTSGKPLTDEIKSCSNFCDSNGIFNSNIFTNKYLQIHLSSKDRKAVQKEVQAQIDKYTLYGFTLRHADSHGHVHTFPSLLGIILRALFENSFVSLRLSLNVNQMTIIKKLIKSSVNYRIIRFNNRNNNICNWFGSFNEVDKIKTILDGNLGVTEIMLHPNIWSGDIQIGQSRHYSDLVRYL